MIPKMVLADPSPSAGHSDTNNARGGWRWRSVCNHGKGNQGS